MSAPTAILPSPAAPTPAHSFDVAQLTREMTAGSESAYRTFHAAYVDRLSRYLLVVLRGDEMQMRDALQETFRRVVRHIRVFETEDVFWSWLTVLARSAAADERRKGRRYLAFLDRFRRHAVPRHRGPDRPEPALTERLERQLATLDAGDRALVEWKYFEHTTVAEIARRLGTTEGAIESRLVRIRRKLKANLLAALTDENV